MVHRYREIKKQDAETLMDADLDGQVEAIKLYCETIAEQLDSGRLHKISYH